MSLDSFRANILFGTSRNECLQELEVLGRQGRPVRALARAVLSPIEMDFAAEKHFAGARMQAATFAITKAPRLLEAGGMLALPDSDKKL